MPAKTLNKIKDMLFVMSASRSPDQLGPALEAAAARQGFGVLAVHNLQETMAKKGVEFASPCRIYEVCNPRQAKQVLEQNLQISTALPCRISVYRRKDGVSEIATIRPTVMLDLYGSDELKEVALDVERRMIKMIEEVTGE